MAPYEETLFIIAVLAFGAFLAWLVARYAAERARERERRGRVVEAQIERFAEAHEFVEFARSEAGLAWIRADSGDLRVRRGLLALGIGGWLFAVGGGALLLNATRLASAVDPADLGARVHDAWWGTVLVALGAGSIIAAAVATRIARAWDLFPPRRGPAGGPDGE
jgi:hypothetical protein